MEYGKKMSHKKNLGDIDMAIIADKEPKIYFTGINGLNDSIMQANLEESKDEEYLAEIKELDDIFDGIDPTPQEILRDLEHIKNYTVHHGKLLERLQYLIFAVMVINFF